MRKPTTVSRAIKFVALGATIALAVAQRAHALNLELDISHYAHKAWTVRDVLSLNRDHGHTELARYISHRH